MMNAKSSKNAELPYQLCVELGQPRLTLAVEDQKCVYHGEEPSDCDLFAS